jgi:hypothetical protein
MVKEATGAELAAAAGKAAANRIVGWISAQKPLDSTNIGENKGLSE